MGTFIFYYHEEVGYPGLVLGCGRVRTGRDPILERGVFLGGRSRGADQEAACAIAVSCLTGEAGS